MKNPKCGCNFCGNESENIFLKDLDFCQHSCNIIHVCTHSKPK